MFYLNSPWKFCIPLHDVSVSFIIKILFSITLENEPAMRKMFEDVDEFADPSVPREGRGASSEAGGPRHPPHMHALCAALCAPSGVGTSVHDSPGNERLCLVGAGGGEGSTGLGAALGCRWWGEGAGLGAALGLGVFLASSQLCQC